MHVSAPFRCTYIFSCNKLYNFSSALKWDLIYQILRFFSFQLNKYSPVTNNLFDEYGYAFSLNIFHLQFEKAGEFTKLRISRPKN